MAELAKQNPEDPKSIEVDGFYSGAEAIELLCNELAVLLTQRDQPRELTDYPEHTADGSLPPTQATQRDAPQEQHEEDSARIEPLSSASTDGIYRNQSPSAVTAAERTEKL